jgi:hypothetical protein
MKESIKQHEIERRVEELRAAAHSDPHMRPALAGELLALSRLRQDENRYPDAIAAARDGIEMLSAQFIDDPEAFKDEMYVLVTQYVALCKHSSVDLDKKLLAPIAAVFGSEID